MRARGARARTHRLPVLYEYLGMQYMYAAPGTWAHPMIEYLYYTYDLQRKQTVHASQVYGAGDDGGGAWGSSRVCPFPRVDRVFGVGSVCVRLC